MLFFSKVKGILEQLKPKNILVLGMETYDRLKDILGSVENEKILHKHSSNSARMAVTADCGGYKALAIIHPPGARISNMDWRSLRRLFQEEIKKTLP